jgi:hypothetical protein
VFAETDRMLLGPLGRSGTILPTGIATDATTQYFFRDVVETASLAALYDFENAKPVFDGVHRSFKFCLLALAGRGSREAAADFAFFCHDPADLAKPDVRFALTPEEITLLNPNTGTCPVFRSRRDAEITLGIYRRVPVLLREGDPDGNPWGISFMTMFHMSNDSDLFHTREDLERDGWYLDGNVFIYGKKRMLPLYQGMMATYFDHRAADVVRSANAQKRQNQPRYLSRSDHQDPGRLAQPAYWVEEVAIPDDLPPWLLSFSDITSPTNERTLVAFPIPRVGAGNKVPLLLSDLQGDAPNCLLANLSTFIQDYVVRQKIGGTTLNFFYFKQFPVLPPSTYKEATPWHATVDLGTWLGSRVLELVYTATDIRPFAAILGDNGPPFLWDDGRRMVLRVELDAAYFHLYEIGRDHVDYILDTFRVRLF